MDATSPWKIRNATACLSPPGLSAELKLSRPELGLHLSLSNSLNDAAKLRILGVVIDGGVASVSSDVDKLASEPREPLDVYARDTDLVVTYPPSPDGVQTQVYWHAPRVDESAHSTAPPEIDVQVSVQTDRLDCRPAVHVFAQVMASEVLQCIGTDPRNYRPVHPRDEIAISPPEERCVHGLIFRLADAEMTYAQLLHPSDVLTQTKCDGNDTVHQTLLRRESCGEGARYTCTSGLFFETLEKGVIRRARVRGVFVPRENDLEAVAACAERLLAEKLPLTT